jgi:hypothetical protein
MLKGGWLSLHICEWIPTYKVTDYRGRGWPKYADRLAYYDPAVPTPNAHTYLPGFGVQ